MNIFQSILFPPPPSLFLNAMSVVSLVMLANLGISEVRGKHLTYSKFWNSQAKPAEKKENKSGSIMLPGKVGMLLLYSPAVAASVAAFFVPGVMAAPRGALVSAALGIHFFKRDLEVLFVHRFSSNMALDTSLGISSSYLFNTVCSIYSQYLSRGMPEPTIDLTYVGIIVFLIGISGNFYHHYILSMLRKEGDKSYRIPTGGLFNVVICPHYLFEVIGLFGIALISQTIFSFVFAFGSMCYLMGRSYATRNWYMSKFEDFPSGVKAFLPYIF
ncbi:hypothetical protein LUZ60_010263 [Juncus effusus]|nr:hypothetical protein LUZ60_010263 [Juncus effusus]